MKFKFLLLTVLSIAMIAILAFESSSEDVVADYSKRSSNSLAGSPDGMNWIYSKMRGNLETGKVESSDWVAMRDAVEDHARVQGNNRALDLTWKEMGPDNVGGRTRAILIAQDGTVFAGAVSGGLWKSANSGNNWTSVGSFPQCSVGSIAQTGNGDIYVGTGNQFDGGPSGSGGSSFVGAGLWRSTDNGSSWSVVDGTEPTFLSSNSSWNAINTLEAAVNDDDRVWIGGDAGFGYYEGGSDNLVMNQQDGIPVQDCQDIDISADGETFLVAMGPARIYRSTNDGGSFEEVSGDVLPNSSGRARVAISDSDSDHCYVLYAKSNSTMGGVYYSSNGGASWINIWPDDVDELNPFPNPQGYYDLALTVHPTDPTLAFVGGVTHWRVGSDSQPELAAFNFGFGDFDLYVHADLHEYVWSPSGEMYIGTDGGVFKSSDFGQTYFASNRGYNVTQFYGIGFGSDGISTGVLGSNPTVDAPAVGGSQDNGTTLLLGAGVFQTDQEGLDIMGGDGFDCDISQVTSGNTGMLFATSQYGIVRRFDTNGGGGFFYDDELLDIFEENEFEVGSFYTSIRLFEDTEDEDAQQDMILINPADSTTYSYIVYDENENPVDTVWTQFTLLSNNLGIPYTYTLELGDELQYWALIERPEVFSPDSLGIDPDLWWLPAQELIEKIIECDTDSVESDTVQVIDEIIIETETIYWLDSILVDDVWIIIEDSTIVQIGADTTYMDQIIYEYSEVCDTTWHYAADFFENVKEQRRIQDQYSSMFVLGLSGGNGIWLTREALNLNTTPDWWKIVGTVAGGGIKSMEFTPDGNTLFYSGWNNALYRVTNLDSLWSEDDISKLEFSTILANAGGTVTGIGIDPNWDAETNAHIVITIAGYGTASNGKVQESWNAMDEATTFSNIWFSNSNDLAKMPCYDAVVDINDPSGQSIVVGTEFGIFTTDNGGGDWTQQNDPDDPSTSTGIDACPVFTVRQQQVVSARWRHPNNIGVIYAGSHGRGIFRSETGLIVDVEEEDPFAGANEESFMLVYPNPATHNVYLDLQMVSRNDAQITIYDINGRIVRTFTESNLSEGKQTLTLDVSELTGGQYIVHVEAGDVSGVAKMLKLD